jgi:acyl-CoA thioesterase-1
MSTADRHDGDGGRGGGWVGLSLGCAVLLALLPVVRLVAPAAAAEGERDAPLVYLALGDSVAAGIGATDPASDGYAALLAAGLGRVLGPGVMPVNLAVPGETTASLVAGSQLTAALRTLASAAERGPAASTITLTIGGNDLLRAGAEPRARAAALRGVAANLRYLLVRLRAAAGPAGPTLVVTGYYDPTRTPVSEPGSDGWWLAQLDATLEREARRAGARWVDVAAAFRGREGELTWFPRDIHPTDAGHQAIALAIWRVLGREEERRAGGVERRRSVS